MSARARFPLLAMAWLALAGLVPGCAHAVAGSGPPGSVLRGGDWTMPPRLRFAPQAGWKGCGPAALVMVLRAFGEEPPEGFATARWEHGTTAGELRDAARRRGLAAFVFPGTLADLRFELGAGRPVVLGWARRQGLYRYSHFVVLAGHERGGGRWLVADPDRGWRTVADGELLEQWTAAGRTMLVVFPRPAVPAEKLAFPPSHAARDGGGTIPRGASGLDWTWACMPARPYPKGGRREPC